MARTDTFTGLSEFLAVADLGGFRAAAAQRSSFFHRTNRPAALREVVASTDKEDCVEWGIWGYFLAL